MSGTQVSSFGDPNVLLQTLSGAQTASVQRNQLLNQQTQQAISENEAEMMARASAGLLTLPTEEARAAAYPQAVQQLRQYGFGKNAPEAYPGEATLRRVALLGTPSSTQAQWGANRAAGDVTLGGPAGSTTSAMPSLTTTQPGAGGGATAAPAPVEPEALTRAQAVRDGLVRRGIDPDTATAFAANALHESSANPNTGAGDAGASHGLFQWRDDRYNRYKSIYGVPPDNAPLDQQLDFVVSELATTEGAARDRILAAQGPEAKAAAISQYYLRPKDVEPEKGRRSATARQLVTQWGGTGDAQTTYVGDSLVEPGGVGGQTGRGVRGASPDAVLARLRDPNTTSDAQIRGRNIVLSSGASNDPEHAQLLAMQLQTLKDRGAGPVTVLGVGPGVKNAEAVNAQLKEIAERNGARFVELPAGQMSKDGVHPTAEGYATLRAQAVPARGAPAAPGGGAQPGPYKVAGAVVAPPAGSTAAPQPPANALAPPGAAPPAATTQAQPQAPAGPPQPPQFPQLTPRGLTTQQEARLRAQFQTGQYTPQQQQQMVEHYATQNAAAREKAEDNYRQDVAAYRTEQQRIATNQRADQAAAEAQQQHAIDNRYKELQYQQAQVTNEREAGRYKMAQAEFDQKMVAAGRRYPGESPDAADMNLLLDGANGRADVSSPDYANAYTRQKYKADANGNVIVRDMSMFKPPVAAGGAGTADAAPTVTKPPSVAPDKAREGMLGNAAGQTKIVKALDALEAYPAAVGGLNTQLQNDYFLQRTDPQGVAARQAIANIQTHLFHELAGAAQSPSESERLKPFAPNTRDTYSTVVTKLKGLMDINRETMLQAYRTYGPEAGGVRLPVIEEAIIDSIPAAAIEHLKGDTEKGREARFDKVFGKGAAKLVLSNG